MNKKINFRKICKYDPTFSGKYSKYDGYNLITNQIISPGIIPTEFEYRGGFDLVIHSELKRSCESARKVSTKVETFGSSLVNEIKFDLSELVSLKDFEEKGSNLVRKRFAECFMADELSESSIEIFGRIEKLIKVLKDLEGKDILIISHSFFMKILEAYIISKGEIVNDLKIIKNFIKPEEKTYEFGEGFDFSI